MFRILKDDDKNNIILFYVNRFLEQNNKENNLWFRSDSFLSLLKILNIVRNVCTHEERMYNIKFDRVSTKDISEMIGYSFYGDLKLAIVFVFLKMILTRNNFISLKEEIIMLFTKFNHKFETVLFNKILNEMGIKLEDFYKL
ncbi:conserved domain protein [Mycoplasma leachii PG50]|uniref:Conserved domain protein n=1 Tax=Mycoplasma leachii (strain DSM 21131 / NCTC 10133 / N29 / PG50) TaxID=880447 RepID=E4PTL2_MYCLG|nr:conserved domain protein [Mycoplasma leachii PG50]